MPPRNSKPSVLSPVRQEVLKLSTYVANSTIETHLLHLIDMRVSQINGCAFCLAMHSRDLRQAGEREDRLHVLSAWREGREWFSPREQAALAFAEAVTTLAGGHVPDDVFAQALAEFGESDLADLTLAVATINTWNRLAITWQATPERFVISEAKASTTG